MSLSIFILHCVHRRGAAYLPTIRERIVGMAWAICRTSDKATHSYLRLAWGTPNNPTLAPVTAAAARSSSASGCLAEKKLLRAPMIAGEPSTPAFVTF